MCPSEFIELLVWVCSDTEFTGKKYGLSACSVGKWLWKVVSLCFPYMTPLALILCEAVIALVKVASPLKFVDPPKLTGSSWVNELIESVFNEKLSEILILPFVFVLPTIINLCIVLSRLLYWRSEGLLRSISFSTPRAILPLLPLIKIAFVPLIKSSWVEIAKWFPSLISNFTLALPPWIAPVWPAWLPRPESES